MTQYNYILVSKEIERDEHDSPRVEIRGCFSNKEAALSQIWDDGSGSVSLFPQVRPVIGYDRGGHYVQVVPVRNGGNYLVTEVRQRGTEVQGKYVLGCFPSEEAAKAFCDSRTVARIRSQKKLRLWECEFFHRGFAPCGDDVDIDDMSCLQFVVPEDSEDHSYFLQVHRL